VIQYLVSVSSLAQTSWNPHNFLSDGMIETSFVRIFDFSPYPKEILKHLESLQWDGWKGGTPQVCGDRSSWDGDPSNLFM
jgi:hypothetical protein